MKMDKDVLRMLVMVQSAFHDETAPRGQRYILPIDLNKKIANNNNKFQATSMASLPSATTTKRKFVN